MRHHCWRGTAFAGLPLVAILISPGAALAQNTTAVTEYHDVAYRTVDGATLTLDAYVPAGGPYPAVLLIHGGGWDHGDKSSYQAIARTLAADGFVAIAANYRLAPPGGTWHFPAPVEDLQRAMRWIRAHAGEYHVDAARVAAFGDSAGANLALMLGVTGTAGEDRADAVVSWSGPTDFTTLADVNGSFVNYLGCALADCPKAWAASSPLSLVTAGDAPVFLANSTAEIVDVGQATVFAEALARVNVPSEVVILAGSRHAREFSDDVLDDSIAFLQTYLGGSAQTSA
jgi:acetyl esterase/lipase